MSQHHSARALRNGLAKLRLLALVLLLAMVGAACSADGSVELTTAGRAVATGEQNTAGASAGADEAGTDGADTAAVPVDDAEPVATSATGALGSGDVVAFQATPAFLAYAADQVEAADSFRFEFFQDITGSALMEMGSRSEPFMTGESSGTTMQMRMDLSSMLGNMPLPGLDADADLSMNMITDETSMFLNAPLFQAMLSPDGATIPGLEWMATIASGWGRIDLDELVGGDVLDQFGMASAADSTQLLTMLDSVGDVLDGGESAVRGEPTRVVYATINLADMTDVIGDDASVDIPADMLDSLPPVSMEVHIDASNYVRRISYTIDMAAMMPEGEGALGADMVMWQQIDFFDFGQPIEIAVPAGAEDITQDFAQLAALGG